MRIREWQDVYTQLRQVARSLKIDINRQPADATAIHRSLLAGLLGQRRSARRRGPARREYVGVRNARFAIARRSVLAKSPPRWVMAAELVETNRMWAGTAATVQPQWIEHAARHLRDGPTETRTGTPSGAAPKWSNGSTSGP